MQSSRPFVPSPDRLIDRRAAWLVEEIEPKPQFDFSYIPPPSPEHVARVQKRIHDRLLAQQRMIERLNPLHRLYAANRLFFQIADEAERFDRLVGRAHEPILPFEDFRERTLKQMRI